MRAARPPTLRRRRTTTASLAVEATEILVYQRSSPRIEIKSSRQRKIRTAFSSPTSGWPQSRESMMAWSVMLNLVPETGLLQFILLYTWRRLGSRPANLHVEWRIIDEIQIAYKNKLVHSTFNPRASGIKAWGGNLKKKNFTRKKYENNLSTKKKKEIQEK